MSHIGWGGEQTLFIRVWKPSPTKRVLKTLRGSSKGKAQREQYLLAVSLGRYNLLAIDLNSYRVRHKTLCQRER